MLILTTDQVRKYRALAHSLHPVVMIGTAGLTPAVLEEIERSLKSHELLKIRVMSHEREVRETMLYDICLQLHAGAVQHLGKTLVIYRPLEAPAAKPSRRQKGKKSLTKKQLGNR